MAWQTPDRPTGKPLDRELLQRRPGGSGIVLTPLLAACIWVLLVQWGLITPPNGGWLWLAAVLVAPYASVALGLVMVLAGAIDRLLIGPGYGALRMGALAVLLGALVLWPRYGPTGVLIHEKEEIVTAPVTGSGRWVRGQYVMDYAKERVLRCRYWTFSGQRRVSYPPTNQTPTCEQFYWPIS